MGGASALDALLLLRVAAGPVDRRVDAGLVVLRDLLVLAQGRLPELHESFFVVVTARHSVTTYEEDRFGGYVLRACCAAGTDLAMYSAIWAALVASMGTDVRMLDAAMPSNQQGQERSQRVVVSDQVDLAAESIGVGRETGIDKSFCLPLVRAGTDRSADGLHQHEPACL